MGARVKQGGAAALIAAASAGCSMTLAVRGASADGDETFSGVATGYMDGGGNLKVVLSSGAACSGSFVYVNRRQGSGVFTCTDSRSGPFEFVSTGTRGAGTATLGGKRFTFTFGDI